MSEKINTLHTTIQCTKTRARSTSFSLDRVICHNAVTKQTSMAPCEGASRASLHAWNGRCFHFVTSFSRRRLLGSVSQQNRSSLLTTKGLWFEIMDNVFPRSGYFLTSQTLVWHVCGDIFFTDHILSSSFLPNVWIIEVRWNKSSESGSYCPDCLWKGKHTEAAREDQNCLLASAYVGFFGQFRYSFYASKSARWKSHISTSKEEESLMKTRQLDNPESRVHDSPHGPGSGAAFCLQLSFSLGKKRDVVLTIWEAIHKV